MFDLFFEITHYEPRRTTILEVNQLLLDDPSYINDDTYGDGWIIIAEFDNERDLSGLLRHDEYKKFLYELRSKTDVN